MKPKLRNDTLYIPSADGVYFVSNRGTVTLQGRHVYQWVDKLAPYLNGEHSLEEITDGLSPDRQQMISALVSFMYEKGLVKDVADDLPHTLDAEEEKAYASEIAFIDYYTDSAAHRFERYRGRRVLAIGSGATLTALVQANLHSGLARAEVAITPELPVDSGRHAQYLDLARGRDPRQSLAESRTDDLTDEDSLREALRPFDAVIHVTDLPMLGRARMLNRVCVAEGKPFIQAVVVGGHAWIGPLVHPDAGEGCWECAWLRLLANDGALPGFADDPGADVDPFLAGPVASLISNQLSFEMFKHVTGAGPLETAGRIVGLDLETLGSRSHPVFRHPLCGAHAESEPPGEQAFLERVRGLAEGADVQEETFSTQVATLFDERTGLFGSLDEHDFGQLPLKVSQVRVSDPTCAGEAPAALGVAADFTAARLRATRRACELYAAGMPDGRHLIPSSSADGGERRVWGYDLLTGRARSVPAALAFPVLDGSAAGEDTAPGLASGFGWQEAVSRGLLALCAEITIADLGRTVTPFPPVDLAAAPLTEQAGRYLSMLDILGQRAVVYDVTGPLEVPTFATCVGERTVAYTSDVSVPRALESALERAVQDCQARADDHPAYAPRPVPALPSGSRGAKSVVPAYAAPEDWPQALEFLARRLERTGRRPVAVPLDHDPVLKAVLPYIVNVVLAGDE
ncbi:TOMM precursor leader peptide-binding protein [Microbispora sp. NPDC046933]|uniref:TOMM precursor leader peptide-binding protein n=1 Tax=Microbispora sp. NPDC046933 TaxID=3155618 RepID=UPI003406E670